MSDGLRVARWMMYGFVPVCIIQSFAHLSDDNAIWTLSYSTAGAIGIFILCYANYKLRKP